MLVLTRLRVGLLVSFFFLAAALRTPIETRSFLRHDLPLPAFAFFICLRQLELVIFVCIFLSCSLFLVYA